MSSFTERIAALSPPRPAVIAAGTAELPAANRDSLGHVLDQESGYAYGQILRSPAQEMQRYQRGRYLAAERLRLFGETSIGVFTGTTREFSLRHGDMRNWCEESIGGSRADSVFQEAARAHLEGSAETRAALFNRASAAIIAAIAALASGGSVISLLPQGARSHVSVRRGASLAHARLQEYTVQQNWVQAIERIRPDLAIITPLTHDLELLPEDSLRQMIEVAQAAGAIVLVDDAGGARLRPALGKGAAALRLGADLVVTSCDKTGMHGPRAGLMAGSAALLEAVQARAWECGMEARAPLLAGVVRALQAYTPAALLSEVACGQRLGQALRHELGSWIRPTLMGAMLQEEDLLRHLLMLSQLPPASGAVVPCEASAAVGMILLRDFGILTTHTCSYPGASVALHLQPTTMALARVGGVFSVVLAVREALRSVAALIDQPARLRMLILGQ